MVIDGMLLLLFVLGVSAGVMHRHFSACSFYEMQFKRAAGERVWANRDLATTILALFNRMEEVRSCRMQECGVIPCAWCQ